MGSWLELSQNLIGLLIFAPAVVVLILILSDGLTGLARDLRSWLAARHQSPEDEAVDSIARYQGSFRFGQPGVVRKRFGHQYEIEFRNHWGCAGKWVRKWELED